MKVLIADDWPKITITPNSNSTMTSGVSHHALRREKKDNRPPTIRRRAARFRKNLRMVLNSGSRGGRRDNAKHDSTGSIIMGQRPAAVATARRPKSAPTVVVTTRQPSAGYAPAEHDVLRLHT